MRFSWKLLPVTVLVMVLATFLTTRNSPTPASANAVFVAATAVSPGAVYTVQATLTNTPAGTPATLSASGFGTFSGTPSAVVTPAGGTVATPTGTGTIVLAVPGEVGGTAGDTITVTATFICNSTGSVLFTLSQGTTSVNSTATPVTCGAGTTTGAGSVTVSPVLAPVGGQAVVTATYNATAGTQMGLAASGFGVFGIPQVSPNTGEIFSGQNTGTLSWLNQGAGSKTVQVLFTCTGPGTVSFSLGQAATVIGTSASPLTCGTGLGVATPTAVTAAASQVSVAASPSSVNCNGTAFVTITVRNTSGGFVPDGSSVSLTTNTGSLSPTTATTLGGGVLAVYTAPSNSGGTASITATASGASGSGNITVNCAAATPVPAAPPALPAAQPATIIAPPNTGSAGLQSTSDTRGYTVLVLLAGIVLGAAALRRARS